MTFAIKVDEDLPLAAVHLLRERDYNAVSVIDQQMGGWKDPPLWTVVQEESRFLITADKGFADIRKYPPGTHAGILLLRPDEDGIRPIIDLLAKVLASYKMDNLSRSVTVVTPRGIRIRRA
jgi:predicted nuclease of predicted toxin-antitoxin system